jgi:signal transduction histidine kinase
MRGILESTSRLERIVELLVDFSAMEAGRMAPRTAKVDLSAMVTGLSDAWKEQAPSHTFSIDTSEGLPAVLGDERLLRRCIEEIVDNAIKFSPSGGTIAVKTERHRDGETNDGVLLTITDEGIGISSEDISRIFSDFHQLDGSETRSYGGLGLGLAFVQRIVDAHGGTVTVSSNPNEGTTFTIVFPGVGEEPPEVSRGTSQAAEPSIKQDEVTEEGPEEPPATVAG